MAGRTWAIGGVIAAGLLGCNKPAPPPVAAVPETPAVAAPKPPADRDTPFDQATTTAAPDGFQVPPDTTLAGKPAAKLAVEVRKAWAGIKLSDAARVTLRTDDGEIEIALFPDAAPNHVRNFLALATVGFYDGLVFERVVKQAVVGADGAASPIEFVTAGCPVGDGAPGRGHLGYFLKPEVNDLRHEEGTVGFLRDEADASAGTRFYITLGPAPVMDGRYTVIGKVTRGREVVRRIADAPLRADSPEQPARPVAIRQAVTE